MAKDKHDDKPTETQVIKPTGGAAEDKPKNEDEARAQETSKLASPPTVAKGAPKAPGFKSEYRQRKGVHLAQQQGDVVLDNWIGMVDGKRVKVFRGAPVKDLPPAVLSALKENEKVGIGKITMQDLGFAQRSEGAQITSVTREG